jgi:hypothetical protein
MTPPDEVIEWLFATYRSLLEHCGGYELFSQRRLVTPTPEDFPVPVGKGHRYAEALFECIRGHTGQQDWPCQLAVLEHPESLFDAVPNMPRRGRGSGEAASSFSWGPGEEYAIIQYAEKLLTNPEKLIAALAFELGRYLVMVTYSGPTGREDVVPVASEIAAVFLGFGIFRCNAAFTYEKHTGLYLQGWSISRQGYLGELELSYALAIHMKLLDIPLKRVRSFLDLNPRGYVAVALDDIDERWGDRLRICRQV